MRNTFKMRHRSMPMCICMCLFACLRFKFKTFWNGSRNLRPTEVLPIFNVQIHSPVWKGSGAQIHPYETPLQAIRSGKRVLRKRFVWKLSVKIWLYYCTRFITLWQFIKVTPHRQWSWYPRFPIQESQSYTASLIHNQQTVISQNPPHRLINPLIAWETTVTIMS